jgi:hypothetical protein
MTQELGKIGKPEASNFSKGRKLLLISLIYAGKDAPPEYMERFELYWKQVSEQIEKLESKLGKVTRIFHESISTGFEDGLKVIEKLNPKSYLLAKQKLQNNAILEVVEDKELAEESMDWERCLFIGFFSDKVTKKVSEFYVEAFRKRYAHMSKRIDETLQPGGIAILFAREGNLLQFPKDIEVFSIAPPALDEVHRWVRDQAAKNERLKEAS